MTTFCEEHQISRKTFYAIRARTRTDGAAAALSVAFFGGSIMGLTVASMGLLDGALGMMVGLGALRQYSGRRPRFTIAVVDWADARRFASDLEACLRQRHGGALAFYGAHLTTASQKD